MLRNLKDPAVFLFVAGFYFMIGKLGLELAFVHASATAVWAPTGFTLAVFLFFGYRFWPAVFLGAFLVNITTAGSWATSIGIGTGNTLEGLFGAFLVNRFANGRHVFDRPLDIFKFVFLAGLGSTAVSATFGVTSLSLAGYADWSDYAAIWITWWLGDASGNLIVAPVLILWGANSGPGWGWKRVPEAVLLLGAIYLVGQIIFGDWIMPEHYPLDFLAFPVLLWAAFRFGRRDAAASILFLSGIAILGTLKGYGPFVRKTPNESLLLLQTFTAVIAVMTDAVATVIWQRKRLDEERSQILKREKSSREQAERDRRKAVNILESITEIFLALDANWRITYLNREAERFLKKLNKTPGGLLGKNLWEEFPNAVGTTFYGGVVRAVNVRIVQVIEQFFPEVGAWFEVRAYPSREGLSVYLRDISEKKMAEEMAQRLALIVETSDDAIFSKSLDGFIQSWNSGAERLYGYDPGEIIGRSVSLLIPEDRPGEMDFILNQIKRGSRIENFETVRLRKDDVRIEVALTVSPLKDASGRIIGASTIGRDITERKAYMDALQHLAYHDNLTGLPNRTLFYDRLGQAFLSADRNESDLALLILDLNRFKDINDTLGHHYGDMVLREIGPRLRDLLRESDTVSRLGGDEFSIILPLVGLEGAVQAARKILHRLESPILVENRSLVVGASIGIAVFPIHGTEIKVLIQHADLAMYHAKKTGSGYSVYGSDPQ